MNHIFYDIFEKLPRVGPGGHRHTIRALNTVKSNMNLAEPWRVLDVGCGTGIHTIQLARAITGTITALDRHPAFLETLKNRVKEEKLAERIECIRGDMAAMDFEPESFDLIWAEGSIFIMGLERGLTSWKHLLKTGGFIALTDVFLFSRDIPEEVKSFWNQVDPNILDISGAEEVIRRCGYRIIGRFSLPPSAWWKAYYTPLEQQLVRSRVKYADNPEATELIDHLQREIDLYRKYSDRYGYVFFIIKKGLTPTD